MSSDNPMDLIHHDVEDEKEELISEMTEKCLDAGVDGGIEFINNLIDDVEVEVVEDDVDDVEVEVEPPTDNIPINLPVDVEIVHGKLMPVEMKDDFEVIRNNLTTMIENGMNDVTTLSKMARELEHPRVYEVLANLMGTMKDLNNQLLTLNEKRHKISRELEVAKGNHAGVPVINESNGGAINNNTIFVGSTTELQKFFKKQQESGAHVSA